MACDANENPSAVALRVCGVGSVPVTCGIYIGGVECADHLLLNCPYACEIRSKIFNWCGITYNYLTLVADLLTYVEQWGTSPKRRKRFGTICHSLLWNLWKYRNDRIFNGVFRNPTKDSPLHSMSHRVVLLMLVFSSVCFFVSYSRLLLVGVF